MAVFETGFGWSFDPDERPDWYLRAAEQYYSMIVHTQGHNPAKLLFLQRPNEDPAVLNFRLNNFEPITMDSIKRVFNEVLSPIGSSPFTITLDPTIEEYIDRPIFGSTFAYGSGSDYFTYLFNDAMPRVFEDANGYLTWLPYGDGLYDKSVQVDLMSYQIYSITIQHLSEEKITFFRPEERHYLSDGTIGRVFISITRDAYYEHRERLLTDKNETTFDTTLIYAHNLGELPLVLNGGIRSTAIGRYDSKTRKALFGEQNFGSWMPYSMARSGEGFILDNLTMPQFIDYYASFFAGFVPYANEALKTFDDWKAARLMTSHPVRVEKQMPCTAEGCNNGYVWDADGGNHKCGTCNGTGTVNVKSPYGSYVVKVPDTTTLDNQTLVDDPIQYVSPPVEGLRYMAEAWESLIRKAGESVYQVFNDGVQSGEAKKVDREGKYAMIAHLSDHIFDHIVYNHLWLATKLRNIINPQQPIIVKPQSFMMRDEAMIIEELKQLNEAEAPIQVKIRAQKDLIKHRYSGMANAGDMLDAVVLFDPLYGQNMTDIQSAFNMGAIQAKDVQKHMMADNVLMRIIDREGIEWLASSDERKLADMEAQFAKFAMPTRTEIIIPE